MTAIQMIICFSLFFIVWLIYSFALIRFSKGKIQFAKEIFPLLIMSIISTIYFSLSYTFDAVAGINTPTFLLCNKADFSQHSMQTACVVSLCAAVGFLLMYMLATVYDTSRAADNKSPIMKKIK